MTIGLLYSNITKETGMALAVALNISHGDIFTERHNKVVRWGNSDGIGYTPQLVINKQIPLQRAINKDLATNLFHTNGIRCPERTEDAPCVGRSIHHTQGQNFWLCWENEQVRSAKEEGAEYFIRYIPIKQEYRVHIIGGRASYVQKKYAHTRVSTSFMGIQGFRNEWHKRKLAITEVSRDIITQSINAVACLSLDFGGVDIVVSLNDNLSYVLEVNTGPSLPNEITMEPYLEYFRERLGI